MIPAAARTVIQNKVRRLAVLDAMAQAEELAAAATKGDNPVDFLLVDGCIDLALDMLEKYGLPPKLAKAKALYNAACPTPNGKHPETSLQLVMHPFSADPLQEMIQAYFAAKSHFYFTQSPALYKHAAYTPQDRRADELEKMTEEEKENTRRAFATMAEIMAELATAYQAEEKAQAPNTPEEKARRNEARELAGYAREELTPLASRVAAFMALEDEQAACPLHVHLMALAMVTGILPYIEEEETKKPLQKALAKLHAAALVVDKEAPLPVCWPAFADSAGKRIRAYMLGHKCPENAAALVGYTMDFLTA